MFSWRSGECLCRLPETPEMLPARDEMLPVLLVTLPVLPWPTIGDSGPFIPKGDWRWLPRFTLFVVDEIDSRLSPGWEMLLTTGVSQNPLIRRLLPNQATETYPVQIRKSKRHVLNTCWSRSSFLVPVSSRAGRDPPTVPLRSRVPPDLSRSSATWRLWRPQTSNLNISRKPQWLKTRQINSLQEPINVLYVMYGIFHYGIKKMNGIYQFNFS